MTAADRRAEAVASLPGGPARPDLEAAAKLVVVKCAEQGSAGYCAARIAAVVATREGPLFVGRRIHERHLRRFLEHKDQTGTAPPMVVPWIEAYALLEGQDWTGELDAYCDRHGRRDVDPSELAAAAARGRRKPVPVFV